MLMEAIVEVVRQMAPSLPVNRPEVTSARMQRLNRCGARRVGRE